MSTRKRTADVATDPRPRQRRRLAEQRQHKIDEKKDQEPSITTAADVVTPETAALSTTAVLRDWDDYLPSPVYDWLMRQLHTPLMEVYTLVCRFMHTPPNTRRVICRRVPVENPNWEWQELYENEKVWRYG